MSIIIFYSHGVVSHITTVSFYFSQLLDADDFADLLDVEQQRPLQKRWFPVKQFRGGLVVV